MTPDGEKPHRRRAGLAVFASLAILVTLVMVVGSGPGSPSRPVRTAQTGTTTPAPSTTRSTVAAPRPAAFPGPDGVESSAMIAENRRPGTTAWRILSEPATGDIQGFSAQNYVAPGDTADIYVSTDAATFSLSAYRMGWYGATGGRLVWTSRVVPGRVQPPCTLAKATNMVACDNWSRSLTVPITGAFVPGDYLFKLTGSNGQQSYILMTVWEPSSTATYLVMNRSFVEQAWNTYGGFSFYQGQGPCIIDTLTYPVCNRARVVSFDRPYDTGDGASDFLANEFPLIEFMEEHGLDATYVTDLTVDEHPAIVADHRALISLGHDEAWTYSEREAVQSATAKGVNVAFLGAAAVLRHVRMQPSPLGPNREEVDYRNPDEDPLNGKANPMDVTGNTWSSPPSNWPETGLVGEIYAGYLSPTASSVPFVVWDASAWIFKGTGLHDGSSIPGVIGSDIDHVDPLSGMPSNLQVLGHSPVPLSETYTNQGTWGASTYSDMTYYTNPTSKAGVLDAGDNVWIDALAPCASSARSCPGPMVAKITGNLLRLFGQGPAGRPEPSVPNWRAVVPAGS